MARLFAPDAYFLSRCRVSYRLHRRVVFRLHRRVSFLLISSLNYRNNLTI